MNIALIGYGKMGHAIEDLAPERGHTVVCTVDNEEEWSAKADRLRTADAAIEFTTPTTAVENILRCFGMGLPIVCGTTGWTDRQAEVVARCLEENRSLFTASNFSLGMNIMFELNERLAALMRGRGEYAVDIAETHHVHKLDSPSGTALTLANQIAACGGRPLEGIPIESVRQGEVPGIHTVAYRSAVDTLTLTHEAHSRRGLALGALLAAEYLQGRTGHFTMKDLLA
ncbi:MAG: 4-hydroxy-tetrahydrodipicolinate reductase [Bacteroidales bacterium]|nr:4-hydroxy-tetrahydrodipicolinate reductase [Bacteroidales bacterium]